MSERTEALWRVLICFVAMVILGIWGRIMFIVWFVHWLIALITNSRIKDLSEFNNSYSTYMYKVVRYLGFSTNVRPWPFEGDFPKPIDKVDMKKPKK